MPEMNGFPSAVLGDTPQERVFENGRGVPRLELPRRTGKPKPPAVQHRHAIADLFDVRGRMRGKGDRAAGLAYRPELLLQQRARFWIETARRLVEHLKGLTRAQARSESEFLGHAFR